MLAVSHDEGELAVGSVVAGAEGPPTRGEDLVRLDEQVGGPGDGDLTSPVGGLDDPGCELQRPPWVLAGEAPPRSDVLRPGVAGQPGEDYDASPISVSSPLGEKE